VEEYINDAKWYLCIKNFSVFNSKPNLKIVFIAFLFR